MGEVRYVLSASEASILNDPNFVAYLRDMGMCVDLSSKIWYECYASSSEEVDITKIIQEIPYETICDIFEMKSRDNRVTELKFKSIHD